MAGFLASFFSIKKWRKPLIFGEKKKHCINLLVCLNFNSVAVCAICCKKSHHIIGMKSRQTDHKSYSCFCKNYNFLRNFKLKKSHHIIGIKSRQTNYKSNSCLCKNYNFLRTFQPKKKILPKMAGFPPI